MFIIMLLILITLHQHVRFDIDWQDLANIETFDHLGIEQLVKLSLYLSVD